MPKIKVTDDELYLILKGLEARTQRLVGQPEAAPYQKLFDRLECVFEDRPQPAEHE